jgi:hypothetical protein
MNPKSTLFFSVLSTPWSPGSEHLSENIFLADVRKLPDLGFASSREAFTELGAATLAGLGAVFVTRLVSWGVDFLLPGDAGG